MAKATFEIKKESQTKEYRVVTDSAIATGNISMVQGRVEQVSGTLFGKDEQGNQGEYRANFNGDTNDGKLKWNISKVDRETSDQVWEVIDTIEENLPASEEEEEDKESQE